MILYPKTVVQFPHPILPEVPNPTEQVVGPVPEGDQGVGTEQDGLCPVCWLGEFSKHNPSQTSLEVGSIIVQHSQI